MGRSELETLYLYSRGWLKPRRAEEGGEIGVGQEAFGGKGAEMQVLLGTLGNTRTGAAWRSYQPCSLAM